METEKREREGKTEKRRRPVAMFKDAARVHRGFEKKKKKIEMGDSDRIHRSELTWHIAGKDLWPRGGLLISEQEFSWHEGGSHLAPVTYISMATSLHIKPGPAQAMFQV